MPRRPDPYLTIRVRPIRLDPLPTCQALFTATLAATDCPPRLNSFLPRTDYTPLALSTLPDPDEPSLPEPDHPDR